MNTIEVNGWHDTPHLDLILNDQRHTKTWPIPIANTEHRRNRTSMYMNADCFSFEWVYYM